MCAGPTSAHGRREAFLTPRKVAQIKAGEEKEEQERLAQRRIEQVEAALRDEQERHRDVQHQLQIDTHHAESLIQRALQKQRDKEENFTRICAAEEYSKKKQ